MSLQDAAASGSFDPRTAQPPDPQHEDSPFDMPADEAVDLSAGEPPSPFDNSYESYELPADMEEPPHAGGEPDMRAARRRAWTVISLAIAIPAVVAGLIAWQLFGGSGDPAPTATRVTTTAAEQAATTVPRTVVSSASAEAATTTPTQTTAPVTVTTSTAAATTTETATAAAAQSEAAESTTTAAATTAADLSGLTPAERLAAWPNVETVDVLEGHTLWRIAQNYGTTVTAIVALNELSNPEVLSIGQALLIPVGFAEEIVEPVATVSQAGAAVTEGTTADLFAWTSVISVTVAEGDSVEAIAIANDTTVSAIMALNQMTNANLIFVGDVLQVPAGFRVEVEVPATVTTTVNATETTETTETTVAAPEGESETAPEAPVDTSNDLLEEETVTEVPGEEEDLMEE